MRDFRILSFGVYVFTRASDIVAYNLLIQYLEICQISSIVNVVVVVFYRAGWGHGNTAEDKMHSSSHSHPITNEN